MRTFLNPFLKIAAGIGAVAFLMTTTALSITTTARADDTNTATAKRCLPVETIKRTKVIDNQNILFYTRNHKVYNNHLPHACIGLTAADTFKFATSQSQLCNVDLITALHETGSGWMPGASCGLGWFEPTTDPEKPPQKK